MTDPLYSYFTIVTIKTSAIAELKNLAGFVGDTDYTIIDKDRNKYYYILSQSDFLIPEECLEEAETGQPVLPLYQVGDIVTFVRTTEEELQAFVRRPCWIAEAKDGIYGIDQPQYVLAPSATNGKDKVLSKYVFPESQLTQYTTLTSRPKHALYRRLLKEKSNAFNELDMKTYLRILEQMNSSIIDVERRLIGND